MTLVSILDTLPPMHHFSSIRQIKTRICHFFPYQTIVYSIVSVVPKQVTSRTFTSQCKLLSDWLDTWNLGFQFWKCSWEMSMWHMINYSDTYLAKNQVFFPVTWKNSNLSLKHLPARTVFFYSSWIMPLYYCYVFLL